MAADPTPRPNSKVIDALNGAYRPVLTAFELMHRLEHRYEIRWGYLGLRDRFDGLVAVARCWRRALLDRMERLGGEVESAIDPIPPIPDAVGRAYQLALDTLRGILGRLADAAETCRAQGDPVSAQMCGHLLGEVDREIAALEVALRQSGDLSASDYLATLIAGDARRPTTPETRP